jgi:hypothetical protein
MSEPSKSDILIMLGHCFADARNEIGVKGNKIKFLVII